MSLFKSAFLLIISIPAFSQSRVVISQVYGGGGNGGSTYKNDFVELLNTGDTAQNLAGWSVQYGAAGGTTWQVTNLTGTLQPGHYYLIQEALGAGGTTSLPAADATGTIPLSATAGKVALSSSTTALAGACPAAAIDLVGFGTGVNCFEGTAATPAPSNTTSVFRAGGGCTDGNANNTDFTTGAPLPRNTASTAKACLLVSGLSQAEGDSGSVAFNFIAKLNIPAPTPVTFNASTGDGTANAGSDYTALTNAPFTIGAGQSTATIAVQVGGDTAVEPDETFTVTLTSIAGASPATPTLTATGTILNDDVAAVSLSLSPATFPSATESTAYSQNVAVVNGAACTFSTSGPAPPGLSLSFTGADNQATFSGVPSLSGSFTFSLGANCSNGSTSQSYTIAVAFACENGLKTSTAIHTIQGAGPSASLAGQTLEAEGIVVGSFQGTGQFKGFYLQEPDATWDSDPATSEGIFVFDNGAGPAVNIGDRVRVRGAVSEFASSGSSLTELGALTNEQVCSTGNLFTRTTLTLPVANVTDWERYEGMAVQVSQQLTVTGDFSLGTFGQIDLAPQVLFTPTQSPNQGAWPAATSLNARSILSLDDGSSLANANLYPTLFPQGGLSASNTLRTGALVNYDNNTHSNSPLVGVLDDRFGSYRIQPTAPVTFFDANPRPTAASIVASTSSRFRAVSANVLNFFVVLGSRGAATATEFDHQKTKVVEELFAMNADVYGLSEVQNFANGNTSGGTYTNAALQSIVDGLNCKASGASPLCANPPAGPWALIDTLSLGVNNGTDAIRSAIVYKPASLIPVGSPAAYYQNDTNRPTLAQTFKPASGSKADQQTFTFVVNHFRSKGSACGAGSDDVYQGNCNGLRLNMATNVSNWLAGNPTSDPAGAARRLLLVGDYNAYFGEDPIQYLVSHGYADLIANLIGAGAYSYNFGSQSGYLDHAMANAALNGLVKNVAEWHINADEPAALEALDSAVKSAAAQTAYYGADPYAASDHDPIAIGFNTLAGDLNDDGVVSAADQQLLTAAIGKNASAVDRRYDYDGDGKITTNDYKIWYTYYRAFLQ